MPINWESHEKIRLSANIFGYDTLLRQPDFIALTGRDVPTLSRGDKVKIRGDGIAEMVSAGFKQGEIVVIIGFREAFKDGETDFIVEATNGKIVGWVKPSSIVAEVP